MRTVDRLKDRIFKKTWAVDWDWRLLGWFRNLKRRITGK